MDFTLNEAEHELADLTRKILNGRLTPERMRAVEAGDGFDRALWADLAAAGILSAALPEALDGAGLGLLAQCCVLTELGRAVAPVPYLASIVLGAAKLGEDAALREQAEPRTVQRLGQRGGQDSGARQVGPQRPVEPVACLDGAHPLWRQPAVEDLAGQVREFVFGLVQREIHES